MINVGVEMIVGMLGARGNVLLELASVALCSSLALVFCGSLAWGVVVVVEGVGVGVAATDAVVIDIIVAAADNLRLMLTEEAVGVASALMVVLGKLSKELVTVSRPIEMDPESSELEPVLRAELEPPASRELLEEVRAPLLPSSDRDPLPARVEAPKTPLFLSTSSGI